MSQHPRVPRSLHVTIRLGSLAVLSLLLAGSVQAREWVHPSGVKLWLPDDWETETEEDGVVTATDPDEEAALLLLGPLDRSEVGHDPRAIAQVLDEWVDEIALGAAEETDVNGFDILTVEGTGVLEGEHVELGVAVYTKGDRSFVICGAVSPDADESTEATMERILASVGR